jgi:hypothetical protein
MFFGSPLLLTIPYSFHNSKSHDQLINCTIFHNLIAIFLISTENLSMFYGQRNMNRNITGNGICMKKKIILYGVSFLFVVCVSTLWAIGRTVYRKKNVDMPAVTIAYEGAGAPDGAAIFYSYRFGAWPLFTAFDRVHFEQNVMRKGEPVFYRFNRRYAVNPETLDAHIEKTLEQLYSKERELRYFHVLQDKNFNHQHTCGLIVLKHKHFPFVVKLFIESPDTFFNPYIKGFESVFAYYMAHGVNRHILGFTRILNLLDIKNILRNTYPDWNRHIMLPRKWFWQSKARPWLTITGTNVSGATGTITTSFPGVYAIIADYMPHYANSRLSKEEQQSMIMCLCNALEILLDPHTANYFIWHHKRNGSMLTIIDTEHLPTFVGLRSKQARCSSHARWYLFLARKCFKDIYLSSRGDLRKKNSTTSYYYNKSRSA